MIPQLPLTMVNRPHFPWISGGGEGKNVMRGRADLKMAANKSSIIGKRRRNPGT